MSLSFSKKPTSILTPYIRMYFGATDDVPQRILRTIPNGEMGMCFFRHGTVEFSKQGKYCSYICGQRLLYQDITISNRFEMVGVHFTAIGAHLFFGFPMREIGPHSIALSEIRDTKIQELESKIMEADSFDTCFSILDCYFSNLLIAYDFKSSNYLRIKRAIEYSRNHIEEISIPRIASEVCLSPRHFSRVFKDIIGISPNEYLHLQRIHSTLCDLIGRNRSSNSSNDTITEISRKHGYYDYAHLFVDFQRICGLSPNQILTQNVIDCDSSGWGLLFPK